MVIPKEVHRFLLFCFFWSSILPTGDSFLFVPWGVTTRKGGNKATSNHRVLGVPEKHAADIAQELVKLGKDWNQCSWTSLENECGSSEYTRVPGCVSTVHLRALLEAPHESSNISILGRSDALLSRGLLAMLADYVSNNLTVSQLLELQPQYVADILGVRSALTVGRNDGLANMMKLIQQQVQQQLRLENETLPPQSSSSPVRAVPMTFSNPETKPSVALLLSGGVDSSVALHLLLEQGYNVTAFYLKIWLDEESSHLAIDECPWEDDMSVCQQVCDHLGTQWNCTVPLVVLSLQDEYYQHVMQHTLDEASKGRTPNPDVLCNERVKFGYFLQHIQESNRRRKQQQRPTFDYIASGHYAQLVRPSPPNTSSSGNTGQLRLLRAPDPVKDQSYFLSSLNQSQLERLLFPIGHLPKSEVRELASRLNLPNRQRPDSQGLCFLGKVSFSAFLENSLGTKPGDVLDIKTGEVVGRHEGIWFHTVGQRKGLGPVMHATQTHRGPWYVAAKSPANNMLYVTNEYNEAFLAKSRSQCCVEKIHWIAGHAPINDTSTVENMRVLDPVFVKIRHGPRIAKGHLRWNEDTMEGKLHLETKDGGLAPGQYAVFYSVDEECLGSAIIGDSHWRQLLEGVSWTQNKTLK